MDENTQALEKEKFKRWAGLIASVIFFAGLMTLREDLLSTWLRAAFSAIAAVVLAMGILQFQQRKAKASGDKKDV